MAAWISPDVKSFGCVNTFFSLKCIGFLFHLKKIACKWIMSTGWAGHLRGVLGSDTLRWFTIWGKQIGSDNTGWSMLPSLRQEMSWGGWGMNFASPSSNSEFPGPHSLLFSWRAINWGMESLFLWLSKFHSFYFLYQRKNNWLDHLTNLPWIIFHNKYWAICPNSTGKCEHTLVTF